MFTDPIVQRFVALTTIVVVFGVLYFRRNTATEILFCGALGLFILCGIIKPADAWNSFANTAVVSIGGLLVVSTGLRTSGALDVIGRTLLGSVRTEAVAFGRLAAVVTGASAFLLNTAVVAMLMPQVVNWCRRSGISPSRLLMPMSYFAILGGTCTLVGTSTNLIVNKTLSDINGQVALTARDASGGLSPGPESPLRAYDAQWLTEHASSFQPMVLWEISWVGVPCAVLGAALLFCLGRVLLPNRLEMLDSLDERRREYLVELMVAPGCSLIGKSVEQGGLRHLPGLFLIEIDRGGEVIAPVAPSDRLNEGDRLVFTGVISTIVDLEKIPGLIPTADISYEIESDPKANLRSLVEVVLSPSSPLVGNSIRNANFRRLYGAAVIAVHRNGERLPRKIGEIELMAGDTLLLQTTGGFVRNFRNRPDFYLVSDVEDGDSRRHERIGWAVGILVGLIAWLFTMPFLPAWLGEVYPAGVPQFLTEPSAAIFVAALAMLFTRCLSTRDARNAIDFPMLLTIGAAIGLGYGVKECGAARWLAESIVGGIGDDPYLGLAVVFIITVCFTEMISNAAVAALMVFVAIDFANSIGCDPRPFIMAVTMAASLSFVSPIGYQTNLMVMGPGGYRPSDYLRAGLPLTIVVGTLAVVIIPWIWHF